MKLADIERAVCDVFGLEPDSLQSSRQGPAVSHPRMLAMWLARKHTRAPLSEIGSYFGRRSHSTVISAQKKIDGLDGRRAFGLEIRGDRAQPGRDDPPRRSRNLRAG